MVYVIIILHGLSFFCCLCFWIFLLLPRLPAMFLGLKATCLWFCFCVVFCCSCCCFCFCCCLCWSACFKTQNQCSSVFLKVHAESADYLGVLRCHAAGVFNISMLSSADPNTIRKCKVSAEHCSDIYIVFVTLNWLRNQIPPDMPVLWVGIPHRGTLKPWILQELVIRPTRLLKNLQDWFWQARIDGCNALHLRYHPLGNRRIQGRWRGDAINFNTQTKTSKD